MHRYLISYGIIVNGQLGSGQRVVGLDRVLTPDDMAAVLEDVQREARTGFDPYASMPNVTSIWKFED